MTEQWKPVVGWEGLYEVSDHGRVRSLDRVVQRKDGQVRQVKGRLLSQNFSAHYLGVNLKKNGERGRTKRVHQLVLEAFRGPCPPGRLACHWDDNPANNRLDNLRWGTRSDNEQDKVRNGNHNHAKKTHCPQGHELAGSNLLGSALKRGVRDCRTCKNERARNKYHSSKEKS